ncbi:leucine-rich repeat protein [Plasmodium gaboni]|uniref:Leucine-rich repeat protein n=1 Tax=Plasmodium gaboni TaxID=647221 RepID=A0ABY1UIZ4_9APIC|nr:leucine-rich repeat protein [Plasmodium gaboni]
MSQDNVKLMNYNDIKKIGREHNLYETDELNEVLYLHMKGFHNIDGLDTFINLKCLFLNNNCIKKIDNLNNLVNLKALYLQNNDISTIENITCTSLVILNLSNNKIKTLDNIQHLKFLQTLNISNNLIESVKDIEQISALENLSHLDISNNLIQFNNNIEKPNNRIEDLTHDCNNDQFIIENSVTENGKDFLQNNEICYMLNFYNNFNDEINKEEIYPSVKYHKNIKDMDELTKHKFYFLREFIIFIKKIKKLKTLFIKNNPFISQIRHVSKYFIANIPTLVFLDDKKIKKEDICLARIFLKKGTHEENELKKIFEKKKMDKYKNLSHKYHSFLMNKKL